METRADSVWTKTDKKRKKDIIEMATWKIEECYSRTIIKITSIQSQFKDHGFWYSHIWYNYK